MPCPQDEINKLLKLTRPVPRGKLPYLVNSAYNRKV
jgi:hypothetical protein